MGAQTWWPLEFVFLIVGCSLMGSLFGRRRTCALTVAALFGTAFVILVFLVGATVHFKWCLRRSDRPSWLLQWRGRMLSYGILALGMMALTSTHDISYLLHGDTLCLTNTSRPDRKSRCAQVAWLSVQTRGHEVPQQVLPESHSAADESVNTQISRWRREWTLDTLGLRHHTARRRVTLPANQLLLVWLPQCWSDEGGQRVTAHKGGAYSTKSPRKEGPGESCALLDGHPPTYDIREMEKDHAAHGQTFSLEVNISFATGEAGQCAFCFDLALNTTTVGTSLQSVTSGVRTALDGATNLTQDTNTVSKNTHAPKIHALRATGAAHPSANTGTPEHRC